LSQASIQQSIKHGNRLDMSVRLGFMLGLLGGDYHDDQQKCSGYGVIKTAVGTASM